ncbi:MAG: polysaccharide biosynthesis protein [Clostridia bacterium]|nr:polysaccharide biosynthesis protein [Clostridia bacterium]
MSENTKKKEKRGGFIKGAAIIAAGGFIAKVVGALYRIPLTNLIGGHGIGLYQMVYPVYCLLLTVSATGIPSSIAKLTAERLGKGQSDKPLFKTAIKLFLLIGGVGTLLMCLLAPFLSVAQGSREVTAGYFTLAPSVLLVSAISVFRGYFQGRNNMFPTAVSEITEQVVKVGFGLLFAYLFRDDVEKAVVFLLLAVSISELFALFVMLFFFKRSAFGGITAHVSGDKVSAKSVLRLSIPVTFSAMLIPLSSLLDSVLAVRLLGKYASDAVALYGLFSGGAVTVINLPVSVCYGIAAASVPSVAEAKAKAETGDGKKNSSVRKRLFFALGITALVAAPCALGLYLFAEPAAKIIFRSLKADELITLVRLIKIFSVSALTLSLVQTLSACLTAQGKPKFAALSMLIGVVVKTGVYTVLLQNAEISVFGLAHATNLCYLIAFLLDFIYNIIVSKKSKEN